jgi:hypothetical protein
VCLAAPTPVRDQQAACLDRAIESLAVAAARTQVETWPALDSITACMASPPVGPPRWHVLAGRVDPNDDLLLSEKGDRIFHHSGEHLYISTLDELDAGTFAVPAQPYLRAIFRDQRRVLLADDHRAFVRDLATGAERSAGRVPDVFVALAPGEQQLTYADGNVLYRRALDEDAAPEVIVDAGERIHDFAWSPDGARLALLIGATRITTLRVVVVATGAFRDHANRLDATKSMTVAWLDDQRLLLASDSVWSLRLDRDGALTEPPSVLVLAEPAQRYMIEAVGGRRVLLRRVQVRDDLMRLDRGGPVALGRGIDTTGLLGIDDGGGRIAVRRDDAIIWVSLRDGSLTPAGRWAGSVAVRDGHLLAVEHRDAGGWRIVELGAGGPGVEVAAMPAALDAIAPSIVCGAPPASRCLVYAAVGAEVRGVLLDGTTVGAVRTLPIDRRTFAPALSPDGRRLAFASSEGGVRTLDLETGAETSWRAPSGCLHQFVDWPHRNDTLLVSILCPEPPQSRLVELQPGGGARLIYGDALWIAGVISTRSGENFVSLRTSMRDAAWLDGL